MNIESEKWTRVVHNLTLSGAFKPIEGPQPDPWTPTQDPQPLPWKAIFVARDVLTVASTLFDFADSLKDEAAGKDVTSMALRVLADFNDDFCGTVPHRFPHWPVVIKWPNPHPEYTDWGPHPSPVDYLIVAAEFQTYSATLKNEVFQREIDNVAASCLKTAFAHI